MKQRLTHVSCLVTGASLLLLLIVAAYSGVRWTTAPWNPSEAVTHVLTASPWSYRLDAQDAVIRYGDKALPYLRAQTKDYTSFPRLSGSRVGVILGEIGSPAALEALQDLFYRSDEKYRHIGALGLAIAHKYPEPIDENAYLTQHISRLKAKALGRLGDPNATPFLVSALANGGEEFWRDAGLADGLALIGDSRAVPTLRAVLRDPNRHALDAFFRALVILEDERVAIPLAIARVEKESRSSTSDLLGVLRFVTGQRFGRDEEKWRTWWEENGATFVVPSHIVRELREQAMTVY